VLLTNGFPRFLHTFSRCSNSCSSTPRWSSRRPPRRSWSRAASCRPLRSGRLGLLWFFKYFKINNLFFLI
jgi:hypothetical protein